MDRCADRAIVVRFVSGMLRWILLGRGRLGRRHSGDDGAACELFEMNVSERKGKLQRHRCKSEPTAPPPIGTNPTHWQNAPLRTVYSGAHPGQRLQYENITAERELAGLLPQCNSSPPNTHSIPGSIGGIPRERHRRDGSSEPEAQAPQPDHNIHDGAHNAVANISVQPKGSVQEALGLVGSSL